MKDLSLAFRLTNWCNLNCSHCLENSGPDNLKTLLSSDTIHKYITEYRALDVPKFKKIVFTGGEPFMPYPRVINCYLPSCMDLACQAGFTPIFKTNGTWGYDEQPLGILQPMLDIAKKNKKKLNLDFPIDEFHDNRDAVVAIIKKVVQTPAIHDSICVAINRLGTQNTRTQFNSFIQALTQNGLNVACAPDDNALIISQAGVKNAKSYVVPYGTINMMALGRAQHNNLPAIMPSGQPDVIGSVIQINNNQTAQLDFLHTVPLLNKDLKTLLTELRQIQARSHQM